MATSLRGVGVRRRAPELTGAELRSRREALGLSQVAIAERLGVPQATISRWETGRHPIERGEILRLALDRLADELH